MNTRSYTMNDATFRFDRTCITCGVIFRGTFRSKACSTKCLSRKEYINNMLSPDWRLKKLLAAAKNRAKDKNLPFNLTFEYLKTLYTLNEGRCAITKRILDFNSYGKYGQVNPDAPSVDRIVPEKGYIEGNIRLVTYHVNVALSEFGLETLKQLAKDINSYAL